MKRVMTMLAIAGLCSTGAALAAQTPAPAKKDAMAPKAAAAPKAAPMAYTGCVAEGSKPKTFVLNDATATGSTDKATYDLKGVSLAKHKGHKVEVTGTVSKPATGDSVLTAKKVKMVAATCA
jgi:hypothetical protein